MKTYYDHILEFNEWLTNISFDLSDNYKINNPFNGKNKEEVKKITKIFYKKYYNDNHKRFLILGSSPARKGSSVTGIPFEDANHLLEETGVKISEFYINKSSSNFLYEVMNNYGGREIFYNDFLMHFVCPLGIVKENKNANYYENKKLENSLSEFIVEALKRLISFGIDNSVCYCIGSGENFKFLTKINQKYHFFDTIIPLEHPRFIMQYNKEDKEKYLKKYVEVLKNK